MIRPNPPWHTATELPPATPANLAQWLVHCHSISQTIKALGYDFSLEFLQATNQEPTAAEINALHLQPGEIAHIREIFCLANGKRVSFGRTCIPRSAVTLEFEQLGAHPIGETLLYNNPLIRRSAFEYALLTEADPILQRLKISHALLEVPCWARRSYFQLPPEEEQKSLLITEIFLDNLPVFSLEKSR